MVVKRWLGRANLYNGNEVKMKKFLCIIVAFVTLLSGCSISSVISMNNIYDNDEQIASENNSYNMFSQEQEVDGSVCKGTVELEGMDTLWSYESTEDIELEISVSLNVTAGKAKLVFIAPDGTLTEIFETTTEEDINEATLFTLPIEKGTNRIKLVAADEANIEYELNIEKGVFSEVGM